MTCPNPDRPCHLHDHDNYAEIGGWIIHAGWLVAVLALIFFLASLPALAHDTDEIEVWLAEWEADIPATGLALNSEHHLALVDFQERHLWYFAPTPTRQAWTPSRADWGPAVEQWRPLVAGHFRPEDVETALCIMQGESGGNPNAENPRSTATGLWQWLEWSWEWAQSQIGGPSHAAGARDPEVSTYFAAWLRDAVGWTAWNQYRNCRGL